jgi:hypothetical protein
VETSAGKKQLWQALAALNPRHCAANMQANGCFDKIVGFVPSRMDGYPNGTLSGYTYGPPASLVWTSDLSGQIGTGQIVIGRPFVIGQHTITLTATNSGGVSTSKSVQVTVVPPRRRP